LSNRLFRQAKSTTPKRCSANSTPEDTKDLIGFDDAFRAADTRRSGRLTLTQFKKAWAIYKEKQ
jgi:hypothetical protein